MNSALLRALRRLLPRALPAVMGLSLFTTGLVAPSPATNARAIVSDRVQALAGERVRPGWARGADTGHPTNLVGFEWQGRQEGAVELRVRQNGRWSDWQLVEGDAAEGPDEGSREHRGHTTAGPVWVGRGVRQVEVRVADGDLSGLKLHAIRSEEPPPPALGGTEPAGAQAQPGIVSRAAWGADESWRFRNPGCGNPEYAPSMRLALVHHTVNSNTYSASESAALVRGIYHFHTHTNGWCDIGYNFLVDRFGTVFEGRAGGIQAAVVGAHAAGFNSGSTGVALLGTFVNDPVPASGYNALRSLLAWKLGVHGVDPRATISFNGRNLATVSGHRDVNATECPGGRMYDLLPQLRNELGGMVGAPRYTVTSAHSNKRVDVYGGSHGAGAPVIQWPPHGGANQQWRFEGLGNDVYRIVAVHSGQVLDVYGRSTAPGADVIQWPWNGGPNQQWRVVPLSSGLVQIVSVNSGMVLDVYGASTADGAKLIQWPWHGGANQQWSRRQL
ncbi:MAG TPA: RICIN domain-containing protein [Acidimicrobiales bacterium]|nr:RICIN domain-containing protein [Acidimicrobiales bacterium]